MAKYRKKPVIIEAKQWQSSGDHPDVALFPKFPNTRNYLCPECGEQLRLHGWIRTLEGGGRVCPGDYIITGIEGEQYPCKPYIFHQTYEPVEEDR